MAKVGCFTCGKGFKGDTRELLLLFKKQYEEAGISRYFYRTMANGPIKVCRASQFKRIFDTEIKPNFDNGAEYSHIAEYNPIA